MRKIFLLLHFLFCLLNFTQAQFVINPYKYTTAPSPLVTATALTSGTDTDGNSSATTTSITPSANKLILLAVSSRTAITANPNQPTVSGNGLTWVLVNDVIWDGTSSSRKRLSVYRAMGASPTAGAITIDWGGQNQTHINFNVEEFGNVDQGGTNGSGAIVQAVNSNDQTQTTFTSLATLAAFSNTNNATYGAHVADFEPEGITVGSGFTQLNYTLTASNLGLATQWKNTNDTSVDLVFINDTTPFWGVVAIEIKSAVQ